MNHTGRGKVVRVVEARVVSLDERAERAGLRHAADLEFSEVWAPPEVAAQVEVGDEARLYVDEHERTLGWSVPAKSIGVREDHR